MTGPWQIEIKWDTNFRSELTTPANTAPTAARNNTTSHMRGRAVLEIAPFPGHCRTKRVKACAPGECHSRELEVSSTSNGHTGLYTVGPWSLQI